MPSLTEIQQVVANSFGLPLHSMITHRRDRREARPRQIAMYLARELTPASLTQIGHKFGNRHHTTVMHAIEVSEAFIAKGGEWADAIARLRQELSA